MIISVAWLDFDDIVTWRNKLRRRDYLPILTYMPDLYPRYTIIARSFDGVDFVYLIARKEENNG